MTKIINPNTIIGNGIIEFQSKNISMNRDNFYQFAKNVDDLLPEGYYSYYYKDESFDKFCNQYNSFVDKVDNNNILLAQKDDVNLLLEYYFRVGLATSLLNSFDEASNMLISKKEQQLIKR